jgi:(4S)-4-hydroxy-5-phosphonooxypentane-2,3-dione isomerase
MVGEHPSASAVTEAIAGGLGASKQSSGLPAALNLANFRLRLEPAVAKFPMFIVHVFIQVKPDSLEAFRNATIENASNSLQEPGVVRFDVIQQRDDPTQFVLVEVYQTEGDTASHKRTPHYAKWQAAVENLLSQPRSRIFYQNVFPDDRNW